MNSKRFINRVSYLLLALLVVLMVCFYAGLLNREQLIAIIFAKVIMTGHFLLGMKFTVKGLNKPQEIFMIYVFGGMAIRLFLVAGVILFCLYILKLNFNYLIFAIFLFYILFMALEIWYLTKNANKLFKSEK